MKKKLKLVNLLFLLLLNASHASTYFDEVLNFRFPPKLGSLKYESVHHYEQSGLGYSVRYQNNRLVKVDLYVYNKDKVNIGNGINKVVEEEFNEVIQVFGIFEDMGKYLEVEELEKGEINIEGVYLLRAKHRYKQAPGERVAYYGYRISETYLTGVDGIFLKIRFTYKESEIETWESESFEFLKDLSLSLKDRKS